MKLNVVEIMKHLPKTNCKECGEPTCMAFAARLVKKDIRLEDCKPLFSSEYAHNRDRLQEVLMAA